MTVVKQYVGGQWTEVAIGAQGNSGPQGYQGYQGDPSTVQGPQGDWSSAQTLNAKTDT